MAGTEHCAVERAGRVLVVTLNRPEVRNAFSPQMLVGMHDAWLELDADDELRCAVLTGAGGSFSSGMDLKAFLDPAGNPCKDRFEDDPDLHWKALLRHHHPRKPIIAAVEGYAVAGGTEILQGTDIRVAGASSVFGVFEVRRGLFPLGGSTVRLARQIPYTVAMELLLTGREMRADEALSVGLVGSVVPDGTALERAMTLAEMVAGNGPLAVEAVKASVRAADGLSEDEALERELELGWPVFSTEDAKEGPTAFSERRAPVFRRR